MLFVVDCCCLCCVVCVDLFVVWCCSLVCVLLSVYYLISVGVFLLLFASCSLAVVVCRLVFEVS